jgi:hypothetical protein
LELSRPPAVYNRDWSDSRPHSVKEYHIPRKSHRSPSPKKKISMELTPEEYQAIKKMRRN